jgi:purine-cytosine permease-like protein
MLQSLSVRIPYPAPTIVYPRWIVASLLLESSERLQNFCNVLLDIVCIISLILFAPFFCVPRLRSALKPLWIRNNLLESDIIPRKVTIIV